MLSIGLPTPPHNCYVIICAYFSNIRVFHHDKKIKSFVYYCFILEGVNLLRVEGGTIFIQLPLHSEIS